jgi:hypothetical protein
MTTEKIKMAGYNYTFMPFESYLFTWKSIDMVCIIVSCRADPLLTEHVVNFMINMSIPINYLN